MYSYDGLNNLLKANNMKKSELTSQLGISSRTIAKIGKGEKLADNVIIRLCEFFGCEKKDIVTEVSDNKILQALREEKYAKISGGIYHETQVRLTYNSNRIEGSKLSEDQTRLIFETNTIGAEEGVPVDDIIETANHFRAIDYIIDCAERPLTEDIMKELHKILKTGTKDSHISWFNVGEYKARANVVGGQETTPPSKVASVIKKLLAEYAQNTNISTRDIIKFHHDFEKIHPFQDGNGRVGRLIAFKECLRFNIVPFIIEDSKKMFYYRGLKEWNSEQGFLIETCLDGQDTYKALLRYFDIPFND
jgi:DNA-binding Xre family transcriptional regulator/fido (protein-threonine AMPylation protein)